MKNNNISYRRISDYNIPNLILPPEETNISLCKWDMLHKDYLLKHKKVLFASLLAEGKLWQYLADIDAQAQQMFDALVEEMKEAEGASEHLKEQYQMEWVRKMSNIQSQAQDIIYKELIYT